MSTSPPKDASATGDVEPEEQSNTEKQTDMDRDEQSSEGPFNDFDVKEQDRWLPIANGTSHPLSAHLASMLYCRDASAL